MKSAKALGEHTHTGDLSNSISYIIKSMYIMTIEKLT